MKVAILTTFQEFNSGYSLTGIVKDQARMLAEHGHEVHLFVCDQYHGETFSEDVILHKRIPFAHLIDYKTRKDLTQDHRMTVKTTSHVLQEDLMDFDIVFTHDFVFTGWNLPYALGVMDATPSLPDVRWLHWIHSVPGSFYDWWNIKEYGKHHKLVFPNKTERIRVAEQWRGEANDVRTIHHIKDLRSWFEFDQMTCDFIKDFPGVMQADVVQIYPASTDRLGAKRIKEVMSIFKNIKEAGFSVMLVIANQWATTKQPKENVNQYRQFGSRNGLKVNEDFAFTSEWKDELEVGISSRMLRELFQCSNLFCFPTREESFGLVAPEASLAGGVLMVLNKSLSMMFEVNGYSGVYFDFGSYHNNFKAENEKQYYKDIAQVILGRMREDDSIQNKTFMRQKYNWDSLYEKEYLPTMKESALW